MNGITFAEPLFLYLLLIVPAMIAFYILKQQKASASLQMPGLQQFENTGPTFRNYLRHILFALRVIAITLLIIIIARPQKTDQFQDVSTEGIDIVLALDISGSMLARDFKPDRLEASKDVATEFISGRPYDRIGLVVFSGESFTQCPLTTDHAVLINLMREIQSGMIEDGTAIGMGLANAVNRIKDSEAKSKVIILLTDGVNNRGEIAPATAAGIAKTFGIRVYTIGVGSQGMAPYPVQTPFGTQYQDMPVEIDEAILKEIAQTTGGRYFRATDNNKLVQVYNEIDKLEKSKIDVRQFTRKEEKYLIPAIIAFCLIVLELFVRNTVLQKPHLRKGEIMQLFRFANPDFLYLLLLLPVMVVLFFINEWRRKKSIKKLGDPALVARLLPEMSGTRPVVKFLLLLLGFSATIIMLARPQFGSKIEEVKKQGVEVIIALDVSNSMLAEDIQPDRLTRAKQAISRLVDNLENDKIGLIVFAGDAYTQIPITTDYVSAKMFLSTIRP